MIKISSNYLEMFNDLYLSKGFHAVLEEIEEHLEYGTVKETEKGLYRITTMGYSDDEEIVHTLSHILCYFGRDHFVGYTRGGAYYFVENKEKLPKATITFKGDSIWKLKKKT